MTIGMRWLHQAEQAAAVKARQLLDAAEHELNALLPGARIERGAGELRMRARRLLGRWITEPALRFLLRNVK